MSDLSKAKADALYGVQENVICPIANAMQLVNVTTWFQANRFIASRFTVRVPGYYRYTRFKIGVASGNIETAVLKISGTGTAPTYTRAMTSGQIACPSAGNVRQDLGRTLLLPGDYALAFWADNATVTIPNSFDSGGITGAAGLCYDGGSATPIAASGSLAYTSRPMFSYVLEADI